jgi:hypothetical protein
VVAAYGVGQLELGAGNLSKGGVFSNVAAEVSSNISRKKLTEAQFNIAWPMASRGDSGFQSLV